MRILLRAYMYDEDEQGDDIMVDRGQFTIELEQLPRVGDILYLDEIIESSKFLINRSAQVQRVFFRKDEIGFYYEIDAYL